jgi:hypothetical protein
MTLLGETFNEELEGKCPMDNNVVSKKAQMTVDDSLDNDVVDKFASWGSRAVLYEAWRAQFECNQHLTDWSGSCEIQGMKG